MCMLCISVLEINDNWLGFKVMMPPPPPPQQTHRHSLSQGSAAELPAGDVKTHITDNDLLF